MFHNYRLTGMFAAVPTVILAWSLFSNQAFAHEHKEDGKSDKDRGGAMVDKLFSMMDSDGDGSVTKDEFKSSLKRRMEKMRKFWGKRRRTHRRGAERRDRGHDYRDKKGHRSCHGCRHGSPRVIQIHHHHYYGGGPQKHRSAHRSRSHHDGGRCRGGHCHGHRDGKGRHRSRRDHHGYSDSEQRHEAAEQTDSDDVEADIAEFDYFVFEDEPYFESFEEWDIATQPESSDHADAPLDDFEVDDTVDVDS